MEQGPGKLESATMSLTVQLGVWDWEVDWSVGCMGRYSARQPMFATVSDGMSVGLEQW